MVCANSSTKTTHTHTQTTITVIIYHRHFSHTDSCITLRCHFFSRFDTVCSAFSEFRRVFFFSLFVLVVVLFARSKCSLELAVQCSTRSGNSSSYLLSCVFFVFWFREWIISIFMSFRHIFLFIYLFISFVCYLFVYICVFSKFSSNILCTLSACSAVSITSLSDTFYAHPPSSSAFSFTALVIFFYHLALALVQCLIFIQMLQIRSLQGIREIVKPKAIQKKRGLDVSKRWTWRKRRLFEFY